MKSHPCLSCSSSASDRRDEGELIAIVQALAGADIAFVDGDHRGLDVIAQSGVLVAQPLPDVSGGGAVRKLHDRFAAAGDVAEHGEKEQPDFYHRRAFYLRELRALEPQFTSSMTVDAALALHPSARWVFAAYHIGGCDGCSAASEETLAEVAEGYRLDLQRLLSDLNSLLTAAG